MKLFEVARDIRKALNWKLGYGRGQAGRNDRCPWWADRLAFAVAYAGAGSCWQAAAGGLTARAAEDARQSDSVQRRGATNASD
jgi:hypothetical protein